MGSRHHKSQGDDPGRKIDFVMKIQCIQCNKTYDIDSALIAEGGSKVRCNRCKLIFWAFPDGGTAPPDHSKETPKRQQPPGAPAQEKDALTDDIRGRQFKIFISNSWLSSRARNIILTNVSSRNELISLSSNRISGFQNCGKKMLQEILAFIRDIKTTSAGDGSAAADSKRRARSSKYENAQARATAKKVLRKEPTNYRLGALPLFSNTEIPGFSAADLHPGYKADLKISDVPFSVRAVNVLEIMGLKTLGDVMMTPFSRLLLQQNLGRTTLRKIQARIREAILNAPKELSPSDIVSSSYNEMITRFVREAIKNERNATILLKRLLPETDKLRTYDEIGEEFDITRERVRQIIRKGMRRLATPLVRAKLSPFFDNLGDIIREGGGIIDGFSLALKTREAFGWKAPLNPKALALLLEMDEQFRHDNENSDWILVPDCECLTCEYPMTVLNGALLENTSMAVEDFARQLATACKNSCGQSKSIERFHTAFVERLIGTSDGRYLIKKDVIFPYAVWRAKRSNRLHKVVYQVLQAVGHPVHFTEAARMVREASEQYKNVSERYVHFALIDHPDIVKMGRGTYGLLAWNGPRDREASHAIQKVLKSAGLPLKTANISNALKAEYIEREIITELKHNKLFVEIGFDYFDLKNRWRATSPEKLLEGVHETIKPFAVSLIPNHNSSYNLVLGIVFLEFMDNPGKIRKDVLNDRFYEYYHQNHEADPFGESKNAEVPKTGKQKSVNLENQILKDPLEVISNSEFISLNDGVLSIDGQVMESLSISQKERIKIILLKKLDNYYHQFS